MEYDAVVTVPHTAPVSTGNGFEIDWIGPFGLVTFDAQGPIYNSQQSPFWLPLACKMRRPQIGAG